MNLVAVLIGYHIFCFASTLNNSNNKFAIGTLSLTYQCFLMQVFAPIITYFTNCDFPFAAHSINRH